MGVFHFGGGRALSPKDVSVTTVEANRFQLSLIKCGQKDSAPPNTRRGVAGREINLPEHVCSRPEKNRGRSFRRDAQSAGASELRPISLGSCWRGPRAEHEQPSTDDFQATHRIDLHYVQLETGDMKRRREWMVKRNGQEGCLTRRPVSCRLAFEQMYVLPGRKKLQPLPSASPITWDADGRIRRGRERSRPFPRPVPLR